MNVREARCSDLRNILSNGQVFQQIIYVEHCNEVVFHFRETLTKHSRLFHSCCIPYQCPSLVP